MTSWLTTAVDESCQSNGGLRGRRRSSVYPLTAVPRLFFAQANTAHQAYSDESALEDDIELDPPTDVSPDARGLLASSQSITSATEISPLSHAHVSDYASKMIIPRHQDSIGSTTDYKVCPAPASPQGSIPTTAVNSRKASYDDFVSNIPTLRLYNGPVDSGGTKNTFERMKWRLAAGYFAFFMCGWGDGITGTVLPYFMADFHISFTMSSLLFAGSTIGFLSGTLLVESIMKILSRAGVNQERSAWYPYLSFGHFTKSPGRRTASDGFRNSLVQSRHLALAIGSLMHASFFVMMGTRSGYPVIFVAYVVSAFGRAIISASLNLYFTTVMPQSLGYGYGIWSFGSVISPLICQTLVSAGVPWNRFYLGSLVLSAFNTGLLTVTFRPTMKEWIKECHKDPKQAMKRRDSDDSAMSTLGDNIDRPDSPSREGNTAEVHRSTLRWALSIGTQWAFSFFLVLYYGCETTTQGFIVSYLLGTRHANPNTVGYVSSGFWGGITIGRFTWGYYMPLLSFTQRKWLVHASLATGLVMELLIWFVNSNIANAFSASVIGLVFGPVYPATLSLATAILPEEVHMVSMGLLGAAGSLGTAIFPFVAGVVSTSQGVHTMTYITVGLAGIVFIMWFFFPSRAPVATR